MSPSSQVLAARRTSARIVLFLVITLMTMFVLFSGGRLGGIVFAQQTTSAVSIKFMNPDSDTSAEITANPDGTDSAYHLVAWVNSLPPSPTVEFKYQIGSAQEVLIGQGNQVGPDTFELFWPLAGGGGMPPHPPDNSGSVTLKVTLFSAGAQVSQDTETVTFNNEEPPSPAPPNNNDVTNAVEITYPVNGGAVGFYQRGGTTWRAQIDVTASTNTANVRAYYTTSNPGADPEWKPCSGSSGETRANATSDGVTCSLQGADQPSMVRGIAVTAHDANTFNPPNFDDKDSGDAHRATGYAQDPTSVTVTQNKTQRVDPPAGSTAFTCSNPITVRVIDQAGRAVAGAHLDVHASGPNDQVQFDDSDTANAHKPPDQGAHTSTEPAADCEANPPTASGSSNQGDHEVGGEGDIKHIETTDGTNDKGEFAFRMWSRASGGTQISVWADKDGNDLFCSAEPNDSASIGWGTDAPSPAGVTPDQTSCPSPTQTSPSPTGTSPSPTQTTSVSPTQTTTTTPPPPPPETFRFRTTVSIDYDGGREPPRFDGRVRSEEDQCVPGRRVVLKQVAAGRDKIVGRDTTNSRGRWKITKRNADGKYYVVVKRAVYPQANGDTFICQRDKSGRQRARS